MTDQSPSACAPCIVDTGIVIHKADMLRLLADLGHVRYYDIVDGGVRSQGIGYVMEVFSDPQCATIVVNCSLYLNVCSFDYLRLSTDLEQQTTFDLIQENRVLRLLPLSHPLVDVERAGETDAQALEAAVADVLAASWDARLDNCDEWN
jgi:hypothetical protein